MTIHNKFLFGAVIIGAVLEGVEISQGACGVWPQEYLLLAILLSLSLVARGHEILITLAGLGVLGFYGWEMFEIFVEGEQCGNLASALNPLLAVTLLAAAGLALGHQCDSSHKR